MSTRPDGARTKHIREQLYRYEQSLGLGEGFIGRLRQEDDWSFVIKSHALLEAGLSQLLSHELQKPALLPVFARLEMGATGYGKLTFADALGILSKRNRRFIKVLGEIRNDFVHNVANCDVNLMAYFSGLDKQHRASKRQALDLVFDADEVIDQSETGLPQTITAGYVFERAPKLIITASLGVVLVDLHLATTNAITKREESEQAVKVFRESVLIPGARDALLSLLRGEDPQPNP